MDLKLIPYKTCPTCNEITVAESCRNQHVNGQGFEERTFKCGCVISWSPNFERLETKTECPQHPKVVELRAGRKALKDQILALIASAAVDKKFKDSLTQSINWTTE